jgi:hypothetical protein
MELVFVHGWSVRDTATYGDLPSRLEKELSCAAEPVGIKHIYLGKYVSFSDDVSLEDLTRAFDAAVREKGFTEFSCVTHSTGGPLVRLWWMRYASSSPARLRHLIMLAPPNHGSALAQLGKSRLGRIKAFVESVEPGQRILDWLELGSAEQWNDNLAWLGVDAPAQGMYPFVLTGQTIDRKLYDHVNSYTGEPGSDGVVRVASANLNYQYVRLEQSESGRLHAGQWRSSRETPLAVLPGASHSDRRMGIMKSVGLTGLSETVEQILACLAVQDAAGYGAVTANCWRRTHAVQRNEAISVYSMAVFRVIDDCGNSVEDFDLLFTAGLEGSPDRLPQGFFRDRQRNSRQRNRLTLYVDHSSLQREPIGLEIRARPDSGLVRYQTATLMPENLGLALRPNETLMVDVVLRRIVGRNAFQLTKNREPEPIAA